MESDSAAIINVQCPFKSSMAHTINKASSLGGGGTHSPVRLYNLLNQNIGMVLDMTKRQLTTPCMSHIKILLTMVE